MRCQLKPISAQKCPVLHLTISVNFTSWTNFDQMTEIKSGLLTHKLFSSCWKITKPFKCFHQLPTYLNTHSVTNFKHGPIFNIKLNQCCGSQKFQLGWNDSDPFIDDGLCFNLNKHRTINIFISLLCYTTIDILCFHFIYFVVFERFEANE